MEESGDRTFNSSYLAHGDFVYRHNPVPIFVKAQGPILKDGDGYCYLDAEAANGTANLGFDKSIIEDAVARIKDIPSIPSFCESQIRLKVAEKIGSLIEKSTGMSGHIAFELGGAQGVELALKIVKCNRKKSQLVVFEGGYHGRSIYTSQLSASCRYRMIMGDWRIPVVRLPYPDFEQNPISKHDALEYIRTLTQMEVGGIVSRNGDSDIAALLIEPILNAGGIVKPDPEYLNGIVDIFRELGALIVVDEIFCGFHRTGPLFGFQHYNLTPDIIVMSKAITNGITPLSCVWAREPFLHPEKFPPGTHSATFINTPFSLAVADVVLERYANWTNLAQQIKNLERELNIVIGKIVRTSKWAISGYALGGLGRILLKENIAGDILNIARTVARKNPINNVHGLILASTGMASNVVAINPPLNLTSEQIECLGQLLIRTFEKAEGITIS